jgi:hypothetical protein
MTMDPTERRSRRAVLAAAVGSAAALAATQLAKPGATLAVDPNDVALDQDNAGTALTSITQGTSDTGGFKAVGAGTGSGIEGHSPGGSGLVGSTDAAKTAGAVAFLAPLTGSSLEYVLDPAHPEAELESGVYGWANASESSSGVFGESADGSGVFGWGQWGVWGVGWPGVLGESQNGTGVHGHGGASGTPIQPARTGVFATAGTDGVALEVRGKTKFSRSSKSKYFSARRSSLKVTLAGVTTSSYVFATLQQKRSGIYVQSVVCSSGYFTIYLNKAVSSKTYVAYLVIN